MSGTNWHNDPKGPLSVGLMAIFYTCGVALSAATGVAAIAAIWHDQIWTNFGLTGIVASLAVGVPVFIAGLAMFGR